MIHKVSDTIKKHRMLKPHDRVVVAVSGGADSVALLHILRTLADEHRIEITMAYLNHNLRGEESVREESFVRQLSVSSGIPLDYGSVDVRSVKKERGKGMSIEEIGRIERYRFLLETAKLRKAQKIALGHHLNDQCETVLINFIRGSGPEGLKAILPVRNGQYIRPLLDCTKNEIVNYLAREGLSFVGDSSNSDDVYMRNKIRHHLIPLIKRDYNPAIETTLCHMADIMRLENDFLAIQTKTAIAEMDPGHPSDKYLISISKLATYHEALQNRIIKSLLLSFSPAKRGVAYVHIKSVRDLMFGSNPRASLNLPFGIEAKRESDQILIHYHHSRRPGNKLNHADKKHISFEYCDIPIPVDVKVEELGVTLKLDFIENVAPGELNFTNANIAYIDHDQIYPPLIIRNVRPGDRFQPLGMAGTQKLKSFFIDHKVAKNKRQGILLLADQRSIIWIAGLRLSERVKITDKSRNICRAEIV